MLEKCPAHGVHREKSKVCMVCCMVVRAVILHQQLQQQAITIVMVGAYLALSKAAYKHFTCISSEILTIDSLNKTSFPFYR